MQRVTLSWTRYRTFSLRFSWFWAICNRLPRVTVKFIKKIYILLFQKKLTVIRGNALQIAQNQANLMRKCMVTRTVTRGNAFKLW